MYMTETSQSAATAAAVSGSKTGEGNGELFSKELLARIKASAPPSEKITQTMEKLANAFPDTTVTKLPLSGFGEIGNYFIKTGADSTANITPEVMSAMADDEELFNRVKDTIGSLMSAGREQELAESSPDGSATRNISISAGEARYVEVQRDANGRATSITSLVFDVLQQVNEALDALFRQNRSGEGGGFSGIVEFSGSWRFESMFTPDSSTTRLLQTRQTQLARIDVVLQQLDGRALSGMSFFELLQMKGLTDPLVLDLGDEGINLTS
ncbi:MAG: hypothetical protein LBS30_05555, partial [Planctomycetota bacterium]|nr:hypothetical protein [Planctomycetota bacterium]